MPSDLFSDFLDDPQSWTVFASGFSEGHLHRAEGPDGKVALRLDYDFHGGGGFIAARKEILFKLPQTFDLGFWIRGEGLPNNFEFKVIDPGGADTWRHLREDFQMPSEWTGAKIRERDLPFAWGPEGGGAPDVVGAIELVIAAGQGGKGSVWFSDFSLEDQTLFLPEKVTASSHLVNCFPQAVFEHGSPSGWHAAECDPAPWWSVDFTRVVRFGGLVIEWPAAKPRAFEVEISTDGEIWTRIHRATRASVLRSYIPAPCADARHLRITFANPESAALISLELKPDAFSHTPNDFIHAVAAAFPRGFFPRYWHREQSYWTPVGSPEGRRRGLINEEGMVEVDEAGFSLEPFLLVAGKLVTWAEVETQVSLPADGAPFPEVAWRTDGIVLRVMPWVDGTGESLVLRTTYQVEIEPGREVRLAVAARPYQVNPPWQAFRNLGGRSPIHDIVCEDTGLTIDGRRVSADRPLEDHGTAAFEQGGVLEFLARGEVPPCNSIHDDSGLASAVMAWTVPKDPGPFRVTVSVPFFENAAGELTPDARQQAIARWQEILAPVEWDVPAIAADAVACFRTAACHILINRDGPAIQPGPRRYTRSWVRDCVIMGAAMAKANRPEVLREFLTWYAEFQREDGYIPSVVDRDGVDPLVEHDSHGQFLWAVCEVFRDGCGMEFLKTMWPHVRKAAEFLLHLRAQRTTCEHREVGQAAFFGLLPESASHEGYLAHPVHSYWDDFWGIRGLEAASELALSMSLTGDAERWHEEAGNFLTDVLRSINKVIEIKKLGYIPGSVEWADFDPTATSNAIAQLDFGDDLPAGPLYQMFETYLEGFRRKHRGEIPWLNYTAYEIRIIGAFVRIGKRGEAHELLEFFLSDRRPLAWNQWPEITWRDPRSPGHLGDVPHTWIAAEYMLALASMVASEREGSEKMVLASGLSWAWISEENGFSVRGLATRYGKLDFRMRATAEGDIFFEIGELLSMPSGGLLVEPPMPSGHRVLAAISEDGLDLGMNAQGNSIAIRSLPMRATLRLGIANPPG